MLSKNPHPTKKTIIIALVPKTMAAQEIEESLIPLKQRVAEHAAAFCKTLSLTDACGLLLLTEAFKKDPGAIRRILFSEATQKPSNI